MRRGNGDLQVRMWPNAIDDAEDLKDGSAVHTLVLEGR